MKEKIYDFSPTDDMEFVVMLGDKEIDWVDPVCEIYEMSKVIAVKNPHAEYIFTKPCDYIVRKRISSN